MRKIREVLRLAFGAGLELRKIERSLGISHTTASSYVARARAADLSWPLPEGMDDTILDRLLFTRSSPPSGLSRSGSRGATAGSRRPECSAAAGRGATGRSWSGRSAP